MRPRSWGRAFWHLFILAVCVYSTVSAARALLLSSAAVRSWLAMNAEPRVHCSVCFVVHCCARAVCGPGAKRRGCCHAAAVCQVRTFPFRWAFWGCAVRAWASWVCMKRCMHACTWGMLRSCMQERSAARVRGASSRQHAPRSMLDAPVLAFDPPALGPVQTPQIDQMAVSCPDRASAAKAPEARFGRQHCTSCRSFFYAGAASSAIALRAAGKRLAANCLPQCIHQRLFRSGCPDFSPLAHH